MKRKRVQKKYQIVIAAVFMISLAACGSHEPSAIKKEATVSGAAAQPGAARKAEKISIERKNRKVSLKLPWKEQIKVIEKEKNKWWYDQDLENDGEYMEIFAVTDFNQNGYLELLVQKNQKDKAALYEVSESGSELKECEVSQNVFSYYMDNPLCTYYDKKTATWHIAGEGTEKTDGMEKAYMCFEPESCSDKKGLLTDLKKSWEHFAVYDALDVSQWEKKLTEDEKKQLRLIADTMKNFGNADSGVMAGMEHECAVCDLNQDGVLDLLDRFLIGSGIVRQYYNCYAVDEEGVKNVLDEADRIANPEQYGENGFVLYGLGEKINCYEDEKNGEIFYVFSAMTEMVKDQVKDYKMVWDDRHILSIHPFKEKTERADRKGEASLHWIKRSSMACRDYQYENVLASYLGWGIQWNQGTR